MKPLIDAHLDLSYSALGYNRDLTLPLQDLNAAEADRTDNRSRGNATVSLPELKQSGLRICFATLLARSGRPQDASVNAGVAKSISHANTLRTDLDYAHPSIATAVAQGQLAYYRWLEGEGHITIIESKSDLEAFWASPPDRLGVVVTMEGTDPILSPENAVQWHQQGLRLAGLTHYGTGQHAFGTGTDGPVTDAGKALLKTFASLGVAVDVTHLSDTSFYEVLEGFDGPLLASHHNCRSLVPHQRQLADDHIKLLVERGAVIGMALDNWMLKPGFQHGKTPKSGVPLSSVADHIDHVCQIAGNAHHVGLGSDMDGGFGSEQTPEGVAAYRDLRKIEPLLSERGYSDSDLDSILYDNWLNFLSSTLPD